MGKYNCDKCQYSSETKAHVTRHITLVHNVESVKCPSCNFSTKNPESLRKHMNTHHKAEYTCETCDFKCTEYKIMHTHKLEHNACTCEHCGKKFSKLESKKNHTALYHNPNLVLKKCTDCNAEFRTPAELRNHEKRCKNIDENAVCSHCDQNFKLYTDLSKHIKLQHDLNAPKFYCDECEYTTIYKHNIDRHKIAAHQTHRCDICKHKTPTLEELLKHKTETHGEMGYHRITDNIYKCKKCSQVCSSNTSINRHIARAHPIGATHKCTECNIDCVGEESLKRHAEKYHQNKTTTCVYCGNAVAMGSISEHIFKKHAELDGKIARIFSEPIHQSELKFYNTDSNLSAVTKATALAFNINIIDNIKWWESGTPAREIVPVTPISCDNFTLKIVPPGSSWKDGRCVLANGYISIIDRAVKSCGINADVSLITAATVDEKCLTYHIYCPDAGLSKVLNMLRDDKLLYDTGFRFKDIDIKCDFACTITDKVATGYELLERRQAELLRGETDQGVYRVQDIDPSCIVLMYPSKFGYLKLKLYNKFVQMISSGGSRKMVGSHVHNWICNNGANLNTAIADPRTQERGLTRIEITITDKIPTSDECDAIIDGIKNKFLGECNWTTIDNQFTMLGSVLKHTLCTYNCLTGEYVIGRWCNKLMNKVNGYKSKANTQNLYAFLHMLYNCSLENLPVDIIMIAPEFEKQRLQNNDLVMENTSVPMNFDKLIGKNNEYLDGAHDLIRFTKWNVGVFTLTLQDKTNTVFVSDCVSKPHNIENRTVSPILGTEFCHPVLHTTALRKNGHDLSPVLKISREDLGFKHYLDINIDRKLVDFKVLMDNLQVVQPEQQPIDIRKEKWTPLRKITPGKYKLLFSEDAEYMKKPGKYIILENEDCKSNWATCSEYELKCLEGRQIGSEIEIGNQIKHDGNLRCNILGGPDLGDKIFIPIKPAIPGRIATILNLNVGEELTVNKFYKDTIRKKETYVFMFNEHVGDKYDSSGFLNNTLAIINNLADLTYMKLRIKNAYYENNNKRYNIEVLETGV